MNIPESIVSLLLPLYTLSQSCQPPIKLGKKKAVRQDNLLEGNSEKSRQPTKSAISYADVRTYTGRQNFTNNVYISWKNFMCMRKKAIKSARVAGRISWRR